jgi:hypothetical protein
VKLWNFEDYRGNPINHRWLPVTDSRKLLGLEPRGILKAQITTFLPLVVIGTILIVG